MRKLTEQTEELASCIFLVRGKKVMLDVDLASLYGVETRKLNLAVKRNWSRFPEDFMFQLTKAELEVLRSQNVISNNTTGRGGRRYLPFVFTEHGAVMLAAVLNSTQAIEASIFVVRAFVKLREFLTNQQELSRRMDDLAEKINALEERHDAKFHAVFDAIRQLVQQENQPRKPIGFKRQHE